jgi:hypothetical protein
MDFIRLNLEDIDDLPQMFTDEARKHDIILDNLKINLRFVHNIVTHEAPIDDINGSKKGWHGTIRANVGTDSLISDKTATDLLFYRKWFNEKGLFRGFHTGTGSPGRLNHFIMDIEFYCFLEDFPILKRKYDMFLAENQKHIYNINAQKERIKEVNEYCMNQEDVKEIDMEIAILKKKKADYINRHKEEYHRRTTLITLELTNDFPKLKKLFSL